MRPSRGFRATAERVTRMTPYLRETMRWPTLTVSMAAGFVFMVTSGLVSCCADIRNIISLPVAVPLPATTNLRELHERSVLLRPDLEQLHVDRQIVVSGKRVSVCVVLGARRIINKNTKI